MEHDNVEQSLDELIIIPIKERVENMAQFVPECSIHRVPPRLLNMNSDAYVPKEISIGPYHHDKKKFKATEDLKLRFFKSYQCRVNLSIENILEKARGWEKEARLYYSESINMKSEEFVEMMVLDGCFIVEFMIMDLKATFPDNENKVHPSFYVAIQLHVSTDLIMLENQLPFFVLQHLFDLIQPISVDCIALFEIVVQNFLIDNVLPDERNDILSKDMSDIQKPLHLLDCLSFFFVTKENKNFHTEMHLPPSATQLREAGVVFKKVEGNLAYIMDISFENGILSIPPIQIYDKFETCARNLMAYAQFSWGENFKGKAIDYFLFLDELISTEKDVNLLVKKGIITNNIGGSDKEIAELFNNICKNINITHINCLSDVAKDLRHHCERRQNRWMASLRHNYFNTPWTLISVLAAIFLILLTLLQTIFSIVSVYK